MSAVDEPAPEKEMPETPGRRAMSDRDDFVAWTQSRLRAAETALHNGDPAPRLAIWSTREPVSVLGAWRSAVGQQELGDLFHNLAETFSNCTSHVYEIVTAEVVGEMAFTAGYERTQASVNGERHGRGVGGSQKRAITRATRLVFLAIGLLGHMNFGEFLFHAVG